MRIARLDHTVLTGAGVEPEARATSPGSAPAERGRHGRSGPA
jgi:hypothetical protein